MDKNKIDEIIKNRRGKTPPPTIRHKRRDRKNRRDIKYELKNIKREYNRG
jgi:hypothetical protein